MRIRTLEDHVAQSSRIGMFAAAALAVALACAGCWDRSGGGNNPERISQKADQNQMNPQPRDSVRQGGRIVWPSMLPSNFNYGQLDGTVLDGALMIAAVLPELFTFDAADAPKFNPDYLAAEPALVSSPKQVVTYRLNPRAIWYDGAPITAADFIAQWKALNGSNAAYQTSSNTGYNQIENVAQGADKFEVVVTFKTPFADWKSLFYPLYPASTNNDPKVFNAGWKGTFLTSAGPFKFQKFDATAKTFTFVPNEKWWGNKPKLDELVFRVIDDDAQPTALANGEIDLMDIGPSADYYNKARDIPGIDIRVAGGPNFRHITMNGQSPVLQDVNVRLALARAIDRAAIAKAELGPLPVDPIPLGNHIFMQNQMGYQDNSGVVAYDPDTARKMLDDAGWVVKGNRREKDGKPLTIKLVIPGGVAVSKSESAIIQNLLAQIHVQVEITTVPIDDFFDKYVAPGRFDFTVFSWLGTAFPISSGESIYAKPTGSNIRQNYARIGSDEIDRLYHEASQELDPAKAIVKANEIDQLIWAEVHSLTMYQRPDIWAVKKNLANFGAYGFASIVYEDIGWMDGEKE
ncbi:MAG TPA: ABC transporter family substrate-binding protein [Terriglobia bacterium]|nr:ABC transporter family substrate-binding protein [Terriglobia bacterium]